MSDTSNQFLKKLFGFSLGPTVSAAISLLLVPLIAMLVSPEELGKASMYTIFSSIMALFSLLGLNTSYVREYNTYEDKNLLLNTVLVPIYIFVIVIALMLYIYSLELSEYLFGEINQTLISLIIISLFFNPLNSLLLLKIRMSENGLLFSSITIINHSSRVVFILGLLYFRKPDFSSIVIGEVLSIIFTSIVLLTRTIKNLSFTLQIDKHILKTMFRFGVPFMFTGILFWVQNSIDKIALREFTDFTEIGIYAVGFKMVAVLMIFHKAFNDFWAPIAYRWYEEKVSIEKFNIVSNCVFVVMTLIGIIIILFKDLIIQIFPEEYSGASMLIPFLVFYPIMYTTSTVTAVGINFKRKTYHHIVVTLITASLNVCGNYILVPNYGALGAAISTGFSFIVYFWVRALISARLWERFDYLALIVNNLILICFAIFALINVNIVWSIALLCIFLLINWSSLNYIYSKGLTAIRSR